MPIIIKDFSWKQSTNKVFLKVPLHGIPSSKANIFTSPQYIKITLDNFFFETILLYPTEINQSNCTKTSTEILFELKKLEEIHWETLELINLTKQEKIDLKFKLIEAEHLRIQNNSEKKREKKAELKRFTVSEQIKIDSDIRREIENTKKSDEKDALGDLDKWKKEIEKNKKNPSTNNNKILLKNESKVKYSNNKFVTIPKPRSVKSLQIIFTPREFPTPSRESRRDEENEYLTKQAEARRSAGFLSEDLRPEEKNPQYLLAKGKEFMKKGNYLGAISALSFGCKLSPEFVDLYLAKSEVHMLVENYGRAIDDCTKALNLLKPSSKVNLNERAICLARRGKALFKLGFRKEGISELEASIKLNKENNMENVEILEEFRKEMMNEEFSSDSNDKKIV